MNKALIAVLMVLGVLLVWGVIGGIASEETGTSCNVGFEDTLCWAWNQNLIGDIDEAIDDTFDDDY